MTGRKADTDRRRPPVAAPGRSVSAFVRPFICLALAAVLTACGDEERGLLEAVPYRPDTVVVATPTFAWVTDPVAAARGLPVLRDASLPEGYRELRLWVGFGMFLPRELLRIVETADGRVEGELLAWWARHEAMESDSLPSVREVYGRDGCEYGGTNELAGYCRVRFAPQPDWSAVLGRLDDLEAGLLPDPSILPGGRMSLEGRSIEVEIRTGSRYHSYSYNNPLTQPWPDARTAEKIMQLVDGLVARRPAQQAAGAAGR